MMVLHLPIRLWMIGLVFWELSSEKSLAAVLLSIVWQDLDGAYYSDILNFNTLSLHHGFKIGTLV